MIHDVLTTIFRLFGYDQYVIKTAELTPSGPGANIS
jgi:hypothetical protein